MFMCSFDIESLYTNIPIRESIEIVFDALFENETTIYLGMTRQQFRKLLELALNDSYFRFDGKIYKQADGLAMGSSLSPIIANIFLDKFERNLLSGCPIDCKPRFYRRYLDDTFIIFNNEAEAKKFFQYSNSQHNRIKFTYEPENNEKLSFLDVTVHKSDNKFNTSIFRKKTFTGQGSNFFSSLYFPYKCSVIRTLIDRAYTLSSSYQIFHVEIDCLRNFFQKNLYPMKLFNSILKRYLSEKYNTCSSTIGPSKNKIYFELPQIGNQTKKMKSELTKLLNEFYPQISPYPFFRNTFKIGSFFRKTDKPAVDMRSSVVYKYTCDCCQQSYIGSTVLQMFIRCSRHKGVSFRTDRPLTKPEKSSIREHSLNAQHPLKLGNFSILDSSNNSHSLRILESIYIRKLLPSINNYQTAVNLNIVV